MNLDSCHAKVAACQASLAMTKDLSLPVRSFLAVIFEVLAFIVGELLRKRGHAAPGGNS